MSQRIYIVFLAAGQSKRYGKTKLLDDLHGRPLLQHALLAAQEACPGCVCLVLGHESDKLMRAASGLADRVALNDAFETGIGSSIACGVAACRAQADAVVIMLADQPLVTAEHLSALIEQWGGQSDAIVATSFSGIEGPPVLFGQAHFNQLETLEGDAGAKSVLRAHAASVSVVKFEQAAIDIDTPADLEALPSPD